jgi:hypothetical protein
MSATRLRSPSRARRTLPARPRKRAGASSSRGGRPSSALARPEHSRVPTRLRRSEASAEPSERPMTPRERHPKTQLPERQRTRAGEQMPQTTGCAISERPLGAILCAWREKSRGRRCCGSR